MNLEMPKISIIEIMQKTTLHLGFVIVVVVVVLLLLSPFTTTTTRVNTKLSTLRRLRCSSNSLRLCSQGTWLSNLLLKISGVATEEEGEVR
jgi:hypothetical protein